MNALFAALLQWAMWWGRIMKNNPTFVKEDSCFLVILVEAVS